MLTNRHLWYGFRVGCNMRCWYLEMKKISKRFTDVQDLPGVYAFTGNGCPSPFCRKGKIRTIILMKKMHSWIMVSCYYPIISKTSLSTLPDIYMVKQSKMMFMKWLRLILSIKLKQNLFRNLSIASRLLSHETIIRTGKKSLMKIFWI